MSVKHALLGLMYNQPCYGYELKVSFDNLVFNQWPLNTGQIYTTLDRLVRDGLVMPSGEDENDRKQYEITEKGVDELHRWLLEPVERSLIKDEFTFKVLCANKIDFRDKTDMAMKQRERILNHLHTLTNIKHQLGDDKNEDIHLLLDGGILHLEADLKWIELYLDQINKR